MNYNLKVLILTWLVSFSLFYARFSGYSVAGPSVDPAGMSSAVPVHIARSGAGFALMRDGKPYFIKGAGGDGSKAALQAAGANSWRTWGADDLAGQLADAQKLGMTVTVGIWLGHKDQGFNWNDPTAVAAQYAAARTDILQYRNAPALLLWGLGNEMENNDTDDVAMWNGIEAIAKMAHQLDPNHPTMTVLAEISGDKIAMLNKYCPDIDIVGINSYAGGASVGARYRAAGGVKPYIVTEFGPPGSWETAANKWGAVPEPTSTEKAAYYMSTYEKSVLGDPLCLGSYAFTWGAKQESTATWYGLLLPDGSKLGAVDTLTKLWTGHAPAYLCPVIQSFALTGTAQVLPSATVHAVLDATDPQGSPLTAKWVLQADSLNANTGGASEATPTTYPASIVASSLQSATVKMPPYGGAYRLFVYVYNTHGGAAVANIPLNIAQGPAAPPPAAPKAQLPLVLYGPSSSNSPYIASGYMGNAVNITMDAGSTDEPHSGKTCIKAIYTANNGWGGVVWQSPANNWGDLPGGWNLTGAKKLTFWARGAAGGEVVSFSFGLIGPDKTYHDTASGSLPNVKLTTQWQQYSIDLTGKNLSDILTGFCWVASGQGAPITFYLDDIQYE